MTDLDPALPEGFAIRRLQLNDHDRLRLYMMPHDPRPVLAAVPLQTMISLYKIGHGLTLAIIPSLIWSVAIVMMASGSLAIDGLWIGMSWLVLLGICLRVALTLREDWLQFCWVVEQQECFVAYSVLRPYKRYSVLELLQVHPKWARRGIGSTLVQTMLEQAPQPVYVESAVRAVRFYTRLGFHKLRFKELPSEAQKRFRFRGVTTLLVYEHGKRSSKAIDS
ncbi:GNAT family N-acetyltransferase [Phormidium sp. FACHB-592]|uniref:GNAT family N-acetyltransferase n=1 Tax=Stenomitos frigidus AS-A4 TaxID=2933935 RepID=A0ABV0KU98_9CYAN|nr:GNAT family N-acetyltransferase [Phormidium sp. FACHB-592]MBD2078294.1 GNAT family N-acetyltransferase [Phormidium sp. FACHB-592]